MTITLDLPRAMPQPLIDGMWLCALDQEQHERTCGYWYTLTSRSTPHTAFRTKAQALRWLEDRGLTLDGDLPAERGTHTVLRVNGAYRKTSHSTYEAVRDMPGKPVLVLDNARYTIGKAVADETGLVTVHFTNCNAERPEIYYEIARKAEEAGEPERAFGALV